MSKQQKSHIDVLINYTSKNIIKLQPISCPWWYKGRIISIIKQILNEMVGQKSSIILERLKEITIKSRTKRNGDYKD